MSKSCHDEIDYEHVNLENIMIALMAAFGVSGCHDMTRTINGSLKVSGDCNPIGLYQIPCTTSEQCGNVLNQQSLCAIVAETLGSILRGCDSAVNTRGVIQKTGGCNSMKLDIDTEYVSCDSLHNLGKALLRYINALSCISLNIDTSVHQNIINDVHFTLKNSFCKNGIHVSQSAFIYPNSNNTPDIGAFADSTKDVMRHVVLFIVQFLKDRDDVASVCQDIIDELAIIDDQSFQNDISTALYISFDSLQSINIEITNSYIDGECKATQEVVYDNATNAFINAAFGSIQTYTPSLQKLQTTISQIPVKPNTTYTHILKWIGIVALSLVLVAAIAIVIKTLHKKNSIKL